MFGFHAEHLGLLFFDILIIFDYNKFHSESLNYEKGEKLTILSNLSSM